MAKEVKCKYCKKLKNHWCKAVLDSPDEDLTRECRHFVHKTNADRIRAMSDEELSVFLWCFEREEICRESEYFITRRKLDEWLQQPAEVPKEE